MLEASGVGSWLSFLIGRGEPLGVLRARWGETLPDALLDMLLDVVFADILLVKKSS